MQHREGGGREGEQGGEPGCGTGRQTGDSMMEKRRMGRVKKRMQE